MIDYTIREEIGAIDKQTARLLEDYDSALQIARIWYVIPSQAKIIANDATSIKEKVRMFSEKNHLSGFENIVLREIDRNASFVEYDLKRMPKRTNITPKELIKIYSVREEDLKYLEDWLRNNKNSIQDSVDTKFKEGLVRFKADYRIPQHRSVMEKDGGKIIEKLFEATKYVSEKTSGIDLNGIIATSTWEEGGFTIVKEKPLGLACLICSFPKKAL